MSDRPRSVATLRMSRVVDVVIAGLLLAFILPLMTIVAIAIKSESSGPIFSSEPRIGRRGRRFRMRQFRTTVFAPSQPASGSEFTRLGAFLRYTRIDSLPQLLNVLGGDLSIVEIDRIGRSTQESRPKSSHSGNSAVNPSPHERAPAREETIPEQLRRAHDLIDEAISIIEYLQEETRYRPALWLARTETHARAATRNIRKELGVAQHLRATAAD